MLSMARVCRPVRFALSNEQEAQARTRYQLAVACESAHSGRAVASGVDPCNAWLRGEMGEVLEVQASTHDASTVRRILPLFAEPAPRYPARSCGRSEGALPLSQAS